MKKYIKFLLITICTILLATLINIILVEQKFKENVELAHSEPAIPVLSNDKKSVLLKNEEIIAVDHDKIINWFKTESQLCDQSNISSTSERKLFCESKQEFKKLTRFNSIQVSPDQKMIGFTITSDTLSPDSVVGFFNFDGDSLEILSDYYLGNEFISFSPSGRYFIYRARCWEAMCGLFILESRTLAQKTSINNPEYLDYRSADVEFVQWISDNEVEYQLNPINGEETNTERINF